MKNQYFGDNRDLFKYDLICYIKEADLVNHFTFIPMLTKNDNTKQGGERNREKAKAGKKNEDLKKFLDKFEDESRRDIEQLRSFFKKKAINMKIYYGKGKYFSHESRHKYFDQIAAKLLPKSLVLVDPDKGLQIKKSGKEHILYCEVKMLYDRMDRSSVLMIFQFFPRIRTQDYIQEYFYQRFEKLRALAGDLPIYIDDNEVRFFFLTKDKSIRNSLGNILSDYKKRYPQLRIGNINM